VGVLPRLSMALKLPARPEPLVALRPEHLQHLPDRAPIARSCPAPREVSGFSFNSSVRNVGGTAIPSPARSISATTTDRPPGPPVVLRRVEQHHQPRLELSVQRLGYGRGSGVHEWPVQRSDTAADRVLIDYNVFWSPQTSDVIAVWDCHVRMGIPPPATPPTSTLAARPRRCSRTRDGGRTIRYPTRPS
jgi:hypothetical protein